MKSSADAFAIRERIAHATAVSEGEARRDHLLHRSIIELPDPLQQLADLRAFDLQLQRVGYRLVGAASAQGIVRAGGSLPMGGWGDNLQQSCPGEAAGKLRNLR